MKTSFINKFLVNTLRGIETRINLLLLNRDYYANKHKVSANRITTTRHLQRELSVYNAAMRSKYRKYVKKVASPPRSVYLDNVRKAEELFCKRKSLTGINTARLIKATQRVYDHINPKGIKLSALDTLTASGDLIGKSMSGHPLHMKQSSCMAETVKLSMHFNKVKNFDYYNFPVTIGFRLQMREKQNTPVMKARVMYMLPMLVKLDECRFFRPIYELMRQNAYFYSTGETGGTISNKLKTKFSGTVQNKKDFRLTSTDFTSYDQNLPNEILVLAFSIVRGCFKLHKEEAELFERVTEYFCSSYVCYNMKNGDKSYYVKQHGLPSGSTFTNLIGTLSHAIMLEYIYPGVLDRCFICSDDNIFDSTGLDLDLYDKYMRRFHMIPKVESYYKGQPIFYLGFTWINFKRKLSYLLAINQAIYHTEFRTDLSEYERSVGRTASVFLNGYNGEELFKSFYPKLYRFVKAGHGDFNYPFFAAGQIKFENSVQKVRSLYKDLTNGWASR